MTAETGREGPEIEFDYTVVYLSQFSSPKILLFNT